MCAATQVWRPELAAITDRLLRNLRKFQFGTATVELLKPLEEWLEAREYEVDVDDLQQIRVLTLVSEFHDARGEHHIVFRTLEKSVDTLLKRKWRPAANSGEQRLWRQQLWCLLEWGYNRHELGRPKEAARTVARIKELLVRCIITGDFPCFGTQYHLWHLTGLVRRDQGDLDTASSAFARALHFAKLRRDRNLAKPKDVRTQADEEAEREYFQICQARTLAMGLGEMEFIRGNIYKAEALLIAAKDAGEGKGFSHWRLLIELYLLGCEAWTTDLLSSESQDALELLRTRLGKIRPLLQIERVPARFRILERSLSVLVLLRIQQIAAKASSADFPFAVQATPELILESKWALAQLTLKPRAGDKRDSARHKAEKVLRAEIVSPVIRLAQRICLEVLVRTRHPFADRALRDTIQRHAGFNLFTTELHLLRVELHLVADRPTQAAHEAAEIHRNEPLMSTRQAVWLQLLLRRLMHTPPLGPIYADSADTVDDGYLQTLLRVSPAEEGEHKFPYETGDSPEALNVRRNHRALDVLIAQRVLELTTDQPREALIELTGRPLSWFSRLFSDFRSEPWAIEGRLRLGIGDTKKKTKKR